MKHVLLFLFIALGLASFAQDGIRIRRKVVGSVVKIGYSIETASTTSAGIFTTGGVLVRTLWSGEKRDAGIYQTKWDGKDDAGSTVAANDYLFKIVSNNLSYEWAVLANSSDSATGSTVFKGFDFTNSIAVAGNYCYFTESYGENNQITLKFLLTDPYKALKAGQIMGQEILDFVATDGTRLYWAGKDPYAPNKTYARATNVSNDNNYTFSSGSSLALTYGENLSTAGFLNNVNGLITGLAVQKTGNYLFISRKGIDSLYVINKTTGANVQRLYFNDPASIAIDGSDNLWMISNSTDAKKYVVNSDGTLQAASISLTGLVKPLSINWSPAGTIHVTDGGAKQQIRIFSSSGTEQTPFGRLGGLTADATIAANSFAFNDARYDYTANMAFQADSSFWVIDPGNRRLMHYSKSDVFINSIEHNTPAYCVAANVNDPTRVFINYLEYAVDYSKPLLPRNGSWTLKKNWGVNLTIAQQDDLRRMKWVNTLSNGRTYGIIILEGDGSKRQLVELVEGGTMRLTNFISTSDYQLQPDGSVRRKDESGNLQTWYKRSLTGFDGSNNPIYAAETVFARATNAVFHGGARQRISSVSSNGILATFDGTANNDYHFGGIRITDSVVTFKTSKPTTATYRGDLPANGDYDIGNGAAYRGSTAMVAGNVFIWGYNGEFWKDFQTNIWNAYTDNGLFLGQFGYVGQDVNYTEAPYGFDGNGFNSDLVKVGDTLYLYHGGESSHSGINRWKITGLNTIQEQTVPFRYSDTSSPVVNYIDLMAGLPVGSSSLTNNTAGWVRSPVSNSGSNPYLEVMTSNKSYGASNNVSIYFQNGTFTSGATLSKSFGSFSGLAFWKLAGNISFDETYPDFYNSSEAFTYVELLDAGGKVICRLQPVINQDSATSPTSLKANGVNLVSGSEGRIRKPVFGHTLPFAIERSGTGVKVTYGSYAPVTVAMQDGTALIGSPGSIRVNFTSGNRNYVRVVHLQDLKFYPQ